MMTDRYVYWFSSREMGTFDETLSRQDHKRMVVRDVPCVALRRERISIIEPKAWDGTCKRQGSWYHGSDKAGMTCVVSPVELPEHRPNLATCLAPSGFTPPRYASQEEMVALAEDEDFLTRAPKRWYTVAPRETRGAARLAKRLGHPVNDKRVLFLAQTANHANFISPRLAVGSNGESVPYSIAPSAHLCSCCLELFRVLETGRKRLLVSPCPGAVRLGGLEANRFVRVDNCGGFENARGP
jgi:hypothetical protein